jgi:hypothetical protein
MTIAPSARIEVGEHSIAYRSAGDGLVLGAAARLSVRLAGLATRLGNPVRPV